MGEDNWKHRACNVRCKTCMFFVPKMVVKKTRSGEQSEPTKLGRCRQNAPTLKGWVAVFESDWCGAHKLDENKI